MSKAAKKKPVKAKAAPKKAAAAKTLKVETAGAASAAIEPAAPGPDPFYLKLDPSCTLRETADLQFSLVAANGNPVVVDASAVQRVDTAGLQLLAALVQRQQAAGRGLEWKAVSSELQACSRRLGLDEALRLPVPGDAA